MVMQVSTFLLSCALAALASPMPVKRADPKAVLAHVLVGNTYNYTPQKWASDIKLAASNAIDVFAMDVGRNEWQPAQVKSAYDAAARVAPGFKLAISLDFNSLACQTIEDGQYIIDNFITPIKDHPQRYVYGGKTFLSTFAGQQCLFGQESAADGFKWLLSSANSSIYFIPNIQIGDATQLQTTWSFIDGYKLWNAWPKTNADNTQWADDAWWMQNTPAGKGYLTLVSPWFFIHLPGGDPVINNRYFRGDNFQFRGRWDQLIEHRDSLPFVEVASWNDYGESHYIGPMTGLAPTGSNYITPQNDHQAWIDYNQYYASWWKTGAAPAIVRDRVYMWARPHPKNATICSTDGVGPVNNAEWAEDLLYVSIFLKSPAQAFCYSGIKNSGLKTLKAGVNELTVPLGAGKVGCVVARRGGIVLTYTPNEFTYSLTPSICNMNAWVGMKRA